MAKAIKHIKAGMLHYDYEVRLSDNRRKPRSPRSKATSLAKAFHNNQTSWQELELMLANNFGGHDFVVTLTYDDDHLPESKDAAGKEIKKFFRRVRTARRRRGEDLLYAYNIEGAHGMEVDPYFGADGDLEDHRIHHHVVINGTGPDFLEEVRSLWHGGGYVRVEPFDIRYVEALARYMTKEARTYGRPKPGERTWRCSRNLKKYHVEYEEVSDSLSLAPPPGAVDYKIVHERNPYGYADCVKARYLLYEDEPNPGYTYTRGRRKQGRSNNFKS